MIDGGRAGVPRYDGDPTTLAEYAFRVRLLEARFANMDETERKKQGPLGLKLVEGLSGGALQVHREGPDGADRVPLPGFSSTTSSRST